MRVINAQQVSAQPGDTLCDPRLGKESEAFLWLFQVGLPARLFTVGASSRVLTRQTIDILNAPTVPAQHGSMSADKHIWQTA